jgi:hypothetical protein
VKKWVGMHNLPFVGATANPSLLYIVYLHGSAQKIDL